MNSIDERKPNKLLRYERESRGWTQKRLADELSQRCDSDIDDNMISRWESGKHRPSPYWQEQLSLLYGKSFEELGFVEPLPSLERLPTYVSTGPQSGTATLPRPRQAIDLLLDASERTPEELIGAWLALQAGDLAVLFQEGWTIEDLLTSLRVVLKGTQAMSNISRRALGRKFLQFGVATVLGGISIPSGRHISAEDRAELHNALGESIATSWRLIQTSRSDQILALGHAQLSLIRQSSSHLYPSVRPLFYSGVYRLIGAALHLQGRYDEAYQAHEQAYFTALEGMDIWNMAQSRQWQADALKAQGRYDESLQTTDAALRLISTQTDPEGIRTKAHLLSSSAEVAALLGDIKGVQFRLDTSKELAEQFSEPHEEFDQIGWHQLAGTCALILEQYDTAIEELQGAVNKLPTQWTLRHATAFMPLAIAYARLREKTECLNIAEKATQVMEILSAPSLSRQFAGYMQQELPLSFQDDRTIRLFLSDVERRLMLKEPSIPHRLN